jgi:hypothetical protein
LNLADPYKVAVAEALVAGTDAMMIRVCGKSPPPAGQNESSFRAFQKLTDVPDRYLPTICKG